MKYINFCFRPKDSLQACGRCLSTKVVPEDGHRPGAPQLRTRRVRRVVVTGMGLVSPLGVGLQSNWQKLTAGESGLSLVRGDGFDGLPCQVAAYVPQKELSLESRFSKSELRTLSCSNLYALIAAQEALSQANWFPESDEDQRETGVAIGMGMVDIQDVINSGITLKEKGYTKFSPHFITRVLVNMPAGNVSIKYRLKGPNHSSSTACTTGVHAIGDAFSFIQKGAAEVMLCGGTEAVISPIAIAAFARIRALSTKFNDDPVKASRPFDSQRCGFVMGEGCGLLVLEELDHALSRKASIYAEVLGYGLSGDAFHVTAPREDGDGAFRSMMSALEDADIDGHEVTHINAHATSTPLGDKAEIKAIETMFGDHSPNIAVTSTKGAVGHLLGAAGSVEAIYTVLAAYHSLIPPTLNLIEPLDTKVKLVGKMSLKWDFGGRRRVGLTNSFGFGGTNASLAISSFVL